MYDGNEEFGMGQKRGMSTGAKVGIGCGVAAVLVIILVCGGFIAFGWWAVQKMEEYQQEFVNQGYALVEEQVITVEEPVDQKTFFGGQSVRIESDVNADIAIGAQTAEIRGRVDGDVDFMGQTLTIHQNAVITGDVRVRFSQQVIIRGRVDGEVTGSWQTIQRLPQQDDADAGPEPAGDEPAGDAAPE